MTELSPKALDRRSLLKRGAIVGGTAVWAIPAVQAFSMTAAHAASPSGSPTNPITKPPGSSHPVGPISTSRGPSKGVDASSSSRPESSSASGVPSGTASSGGAGVDAKTTHRTRGLASTGPSVPVGEALAFGIGAIALGTVATVAGRSQPEAAAATPRPRPHPTHKH